jgi:hypothetical protein
VRLLVSELYRYQNARCNDKNYLQDYFVFPHVHSESGSLLARSFSEELVPTKGAVGSDSVRVDMEEISVVFFICFLVILT